MTIKRTFLALAVMAVFLLPLMAQAVTIIGTETLTLGVPNDDLASCPGPYATVGVTLFDNDTAQFVFTALDSYAFGATKAIGLNLNGPFTAPATVSTTGGGAPTITLVPPPPHSGQHQMDGFGNMNLVYKSPNFSPSGQFTGATFTVAGNSSWTSLANLFAASLGLDAQYFAAAHIRCADGDTGFAGNGQGNQVPVPPAVYLLGSGLVGMAWLRWRRKS